MVKQIEISDKGLRQFTQQKGKHCCQDCSHCEEKDGVYRCKLLRGRNSVLDRRFPYDNTICKKFTE